MTVPWLAILGAVGLLCGCPATTDQNTRGERWYQSVVEPLQTDSAKALRFYDRIIGLKPTELVQELELTKRAFDQEKSDLHRLQLAMILSLPGSGVRDAHSALDLLQPFTFDGALEASPVRPLALLLHSQLVELKRTEDALQSQASKARDEQRRAETLQQKLEALLEMEMNLIEREQTNPTKKK